MKKIFILLIAVYAINNSAYSQTVLLEENVKGDTIVSKFGPNLTHFSYFYFDYSLVAGKDERGAEVKYGNSHTWAFGLRYKFKICKFYAIGAGLNYRQYSFRLAQNSNKVVPNTILHDKEKLILNTWGGEFYNRFNYGRRGNQLGNFIDVGIFGSWISNTKHYTKDKADILTDANITEVTSSDLNYMEDFIYGLRVRMGFNRLMFTGEYRMSDLFKEKYVAFPELPRLTIGIDLALF